MNSVQNIKGYKIFINKILPTNHSCWEPTCLFNSLQESLNIDILKSVFVQKEPISLTMVGYWILEIRPFLGIILGGVMNYISTIPIDL